MIDLKQGITINGKHSYNDFGLLLLKKNIGIPSKIKIKETVPFMNGTYDFSTMFGGQLWDERTLTYDFVIIASSKEALSSKKFAVINWLEDNINCKITDDSIPEYSFIGDATNCSFAEKLHDGVLTVTFTCYPFKVGNNEEGNDIWDIFNFENGITNTVSYTFSINTSVTLTCDSRSKNEVIVETTAPITIIKNKISYSFPTGKTSNSSFILDNGSNILMLYASASATVKFHFWREIL